MGNLETATDTKPVVLKDGRRVSIRPYRPSDTEGLISMYAGLSEEALRWSMPPYNRQRIERWTSNLENTIALIAQDENRIVGHLQISIGTSPRFREMGVIADNHRAIHLYEKIGFQREGLKRENYLGEDGKYHDEIIMGILL